MEKKENKVEEVVKSEEEIIKKDKKKKDIAKKEDNVMEKENNKKEVAVDSNKKSNLESKNNNIKKEEQEKVMNIIKRAKENGKITYGELANELEDTNPEQLDKIFDTFEDLGVDIKDSDDLDIEPDIDDLEEMENIKVEDVDLTNMDGVSIDDPVRMYLREIGQGCCRVHGGGFAGVIMCLIPKDFTLEYLGYMEGIVRRDNMYVLKIRKTGAKHLDL